MSDDHPAARRRQILDGARRCFADYGYDKVAVRRMGTVLALNKDFEPIAEITPVDRAPTSLIGDKYTTERPLTLNTILDPSSAHTV